MDKKLPNKIRLVKIGEAAKILGVSIDTLRRWEKAGKLESVRTPGGTRLYSVKTLKSFANPSASKTYTTPKSSLPSSTPSSVIPSEPIRRVEGSIQASQLKQIPPLGRSIDLGRNDLITSKNEIITSSSLIANSSPNQEETKTLSTKEILKLLKEESNLLTPQYVIPSDPALVGESRDLHNPTFSETDSSTQANAFGRNDNYTKHNTIKPFQSISIIQKIAFSFTVITLVASLFIASMFNLKPEISNQIMAQLKNDAEDLLASTFSSNIPSLPTLPNLIKPKPKDDIPKLVLGNLSQVLAASSSAGFLQINGDVKIEGSLDSNDFNGLTLQPLVSGFSLSNATASATLTLATNQVLLDQNLSRSSAPTFTTLNLTATSNQLILGSNGTLTWTPTAARIITLPDATTTLVGTDTTQTLTNKSLSGSSNTFTNIPNSALTNKKVSVTAGTNLSGGGDAELGSSVTLSLKDSPSISGTLTVAGATTLSSTLGVTGASTLSSTLAVTGATTLSSTLAVTGATTLTGDLTANGSVNLGDTSSDDIAVNGRLTTSVIPKTDSSVDLGSSSLKFANIYANNIVTSGTSSTGQGLFTYQPTSTAINEGSVYVNPTTVPVANVSLLSLAIGGVEKARINSNGFLGLNGANDPGSSYIINAGSSFNVSSTGALTSTGLTSSGTITFSGLTADRGVFTTTGGELTTTAASSTLISSLSDETGSGVAVFGTSPTITTSLVSGSVSFDLLNSTATTINFGGAATTFNIGPTGASGSLVFSGGSSDTGCTLDGTTGNLTCSGNITTPGKIAIGKTTASVPLDVNATQTSGTIGQIAYGAVTTLDGALTGLLVNLDDGTVVATNQDVTVLQSKLPTTTNTNAAGTVNLRGLYSTFGSGAGINQNGAGATVYSAAEFTLPALTQTAGTLTANGLLVNTPSGITTGGTANGLNINATGVGAGSLYGVNIGAITGGAGTEYALSVGTGWDVALRVGSTTIINGSGVTQVAGGGTGIASYTAGDLLYASDTTVLSKLAGGVANNGKVLTISAGVPTWGTINGSACTDCVVNDPTSVTTQTITPNNQDISSLVVRQTTYATPTKDIFQVTNSDGTSKYFYVDSSGNVSTGGVASQTLTLTPASDTTALTLVGTNVTTQSLQYINAKNTQGSIFNLAYGAAQTLSDSVALTGSAIDLSTNVTATNATITGSSITLPGATNTHTSGSKNIKGLNISAGGGINQTGAGGTTNFIGVDVTVPALTQTDGILTGTGLKVTTPSSITTNGTSYGLDIVGTGVSTGTLYGVNIGNITAGAGTERAINIGTGWDYGIYSATTSNSYFAGSLGLGTTAPDKKLEINSATGANLRLTYNDADGSATNYADFSTTSGGNLTIAPSGATTNITGNLDVSAHGAFGNNASISSFIGLNVSETFTNTATETAASMTSVVTANAASESNSKFLAADLTAKTSANSTTYTSYLSAASAVTSHYGTGYLANAINNWSFVTNESTGTINSASNYVADVYNKEPLSIINTLTGYSFVLSENDGSIGTARGFHINTADGGTNVTNYYGGWITSTSKGSSVNVGLLLGETSNGNNTNLLIGPTCASSSSCTIPTGSFSIYNASTDDNYFAGDLGLYDSSPDAKLDIDSTSTSGADFLITNTGVGTSGTIAAVTANSVTTGDIFALNGTALTSGSLAILTGPSGATAGVTDAGFKITSDVGNIGTANGLISSTATIDSTAAGANGVNLYLSTTNSNSTNANTAYGLYNTLSDAVALGNTNYGEYLSVSNTGAITTQTKTIYGSYISASGTGGTTTTPTTNVYGQYLTTTASHATDAGTINQYGLYIANGTSSTNGTSAKYGLYLESPTGADTNYALYSAGGTNYFGGNTFINDTTHSNITLGLTINQSTNDDLVMAFKSSDVAHGGQSTVFETDDFGWIRKVEGTGGGLLLGGVADADSVVNTGVYLGGYTRNNIDTTKTTAGAGAIAIEANQLNGSGSATDVVSNANLLVIKGRTGGDTPTRFIFDAEGDFFNHGLIYPGNQSAFQSTNYLSGTTTGIGINDISPDANLDIDSSATTGNIFGILSTTLTTGNAIDLTATYVDATGGTDSGIDINLTNTPTVSANTLRGVDVTLTDGTALANTLYGTYSTVDNSANTASGTHSIYGGYFTATGKTAGTTTAIGLYASASGADTNNAAIFENGNVGIGTTSPGSFENHSVKLDVDSTFTATSGYTNALVAVNRVNPSAGSTASSWGLQGIATVPVANAQDISHSYALVGVEGTVNHYGSGTVLAAIGTSGYINNGGAGIITDAKLLYATNVNSGAGSITNAYGLYIDALAGTNNVGALISEVTGTKNTNLLIGTTTIPTGSFSIYNASTDDNYFGGKIGIGTTAPDKALEINSATGANLRLTYNDADGSAANYTDFSLSSTGALTLTGSNATLADGATAEKTYLTLTPGTTTLTGPTQVTSLMETSVITGATIAATNATIVDKATTLSLVAPIDSTNTTLTASSALRVLNVTSGAGTLTSQYGLYIEALTAGTNDYGIYVADADTGSIVLASDDGDAASGITFGTTNAANLYKSAADTLKTDDNFIVGTDLTVTGGDITGANGEGIDIGEASNGTISLLIDGTSGLNIGSTGISSIGNVAHTIVNSSGALNIDSNSTGAINIGTGANAKTITIGNNTTTSALAFTSGTGSQTFTSSVVSTTGTSSAFVYNDAALTTGTLMYLQAAAITSGKLLDINTGSSIFSISNTDVTTSLPVNFTSSGDVSIAYDINFTNPTASYIKSSSPLYIQAGPSYANNDLVFQTFGTGTVLVDQSVATTGSPTAFKVNGAAHTTLTASTEATDINFNLARTVQFATGALTTQRAMQITAPTYGFVGASTLTTATTLDIGAAPSAGTNATITNSSALRVGATGTSLASVAGLSYQAISVPAQTLTATGTTAVTATTTAGVGIGQITLTDASALTFATASGLYIADTPTQAGSVTLTNSYGLNIAAVTGLGGTIHAGINIGNISGTTANAGGIKIGTLTGGTSTNYQISAGNITSVASATNAGLVLGTISGTANSSTNYGINIGAISSAGTTTTNYGINIGAVSGATTNYALVTNGGIIKNNSTSSVITSSAALATDATDGFLYIPTSAGAPTGVPTSQTGTVAIEYDTTNNKLMIYNGAWKGATTPGAFADYAEWAPAAGTEIGDIVTTTTNPNTVEDPTAPFMLGKTTTSYDQKIIGVISKYAEEANDANGYKRSPDYHAVALVGRVPVKVSTENGAITKGDYLTSSSIPGVAMKATRPGFTLGKAMEDFSGNPSLISENQIMAFIQPAYADPGNFLASLSLDNDGNLIAPKIKTDKLTISTTIDLARTDNKGLLSYNSYNVYNGYNSYTAYEIDVAASLKNLETAIIETKDQTATASAKLADLETSTATQSAALADLKAQVASMAGQLTATPSATLALTPPEVMIATGSATLADLKVTSQATFSAQLAAYDVTISNTFKAFGETTLAKTNIAGDLNIDGTLTLSQNSISSLGTLYLQNSALSTSIDLFAGKVLIDNTGKLTAQTISATEYLGVSGSTVGTGKIAAGTKTVTVNSTLVKANSRILITPTSETSQALSVISKTANTSFSVSVPAITTTDITFDWFIINETQ